MKFPESRRAPLYFAAAVERGFVRRLGADPYYRGLIAKNPLHPAWCTTWLADDPYDLSQMADWLFEPDTRNYPEPRGEPGLGRNCQVFDDLRAIAYREVLTFKLQRASCAVFAKHLEDRARIINRQFAHPLGLSEIRGIARSIAKWTWRLFSPERFSEIQSWRGARTRTTTKIRMGIVDVLADGEA